MAESPQKHFWPSSALTCDTGLNLTGSLQLRKDSGSMVCFLPVAAPRSCVEDAEPSASSELKLTDPYARKTLLLEAAVFFTDGIILVSLILV